MALHTVVSRLRRDLVPIWPHTTSQALSDHITLALPGPFCMDSSTWIEQRGQGIGSYDVAISANWLRCAMQDISERVYTEYRARILRKDRSVALRATLYWAV